MLHRALKAKADVLRFYDELRTLQHTESAAAVSAAQRLSRNSIYRYNEAMEMLKLAMIERSRIPTRSGEML